jgi:hypothetical protein
MMDNFTTVKISGAVTVGRARALWESGILKVFGPDGLLYELISERPKKRPGHIWVWDARTGIGDITMRQKCITCGGRKWYRVAFMPDQKLWSSEI